MDGYTLTEKMRAARRRFRLTATEQALFYELVAICNSEGWEDVFKCSNMELCLALNVDEKTLCKARLSLTNAKLIYYKSGKSKRIVGSYSFETDITAGNFTVDKPANKPTNPPANKPTNPPANAPDLYKTKKENKDNNSNSSSSDELLCGTLQPHAARINYDELIKFFNHETNGIFGTIRSPLSDTRKGLINARIKTHGKDMFANMIRKANQSDFLKGQNKNGWRASFDWLIKPTNFEKVISGNYDNKNSKNSATSDGIDEDFMRNIAEGIARGNLERDRRDE